MKSEIVMSGEEPFDWDNHHKKFKGYEVPDFEGEVPSRDFAEFVTKYVATETKKELGDELVDVLLFGSTIKEPFNEESDIDICFVVNCTEREYGTILWYLSYDISFDITSKFGVPIHTVNISKEEYEAPTIFFTSMVKREGISWRDM